MENSPALLSSLAYAAMALALARLFTAPSAAALGLVRWPVFLAVLAQIVLQAMLGLTSGAVARVVAMGAGIGLLCLAASLFLLLREVRKRLARTLSARGRARLAQAEAQIGDAQAWLEIVAQTAQLGHWRLNLPAQTLQWSDEVYRIHGVSPDSFEPELESAAAMIHPDDRAYVMSAIAAVVENAGSFEVRPRLRRPDGEIRYVILRGRAQGKTAILGVLADVTEQKHAELRLREANQVAIQANAALRDMTTEDDLTGLANRRQFDLSLVAEFKRALRSNMPLGLVLIDLDQFQAYNEHYGPPAGDACLRRVAQAIKQVPRRTGDLVARYAGAEFAVLLPLANAQGAARVAGLIAEAIRAARIPHAASDLGVVTISCGTAAFTGVQDLNNPLELVRRADQALFRAKAEGRDRIFQFATGWGNENNNPYPAPLVPDMDRFIKSRS